MGEGVSTYSLSNGKNVDNCTDRQIQYIQIDTARGGDSMLGE